MIRHRLASLLVLTLFAWFGLGSIERPLLLHNGNIITMNPGQPEAEAVMVRHGRITAVGSSAELTATAPRFTRRLDLQQRLLVPGFVDAHSHFPVNGMLAVAEDLRPPPLGPIGSIPELLAKLESTIATTAVGEWVLGFNYDPSLMREGLHPTRAQLDALSQQHPIYLWHSSGHLGVANTLALQRLGHPIELNPQGLLLEQQAPTLADLLGHLSLADYLRLLHYARREYTEAGVTTLNNGAASSRLITALGWLRTLRWLPQRVLVAPLVSSVDTTQAAQPLRHPAANWRSPFFFPGPVKIIVDGSPQGFTARLRNGFFNIASVSEYGANHRGIARYTATELNALVARLNAGGLQLALHGNGDGGIDLILDAIAAGGLASAHRAANRPAHQPAHEPAHEPEHEPEHRSVLVHSQLAQRDQITRMANLGVTPSFFASHVYYWGEWHRRHTVGPQRAEHLSPAGWALQQGMRFSLHSDAPVTPVSPLQLMRIAVTRRSHQGRLLGAEHRLQPLQALRAVTVDAAWQYFLDDQLGAVVVGLVADFVILDRSLEVLLDAELPEVVATIIAGETVHCADNIVCRDW